jgi:hypothetical protein
LTTEYLQKNNLKQPVADIMLFHWGQVQGKDVLSRHSFQHHTGCPSKYKKQEMEIKDRLAGEEK